MSRQIADSIKAGETWEIRLEDEIVGEFVVRSIDRKGHVIGDLPGPGEGASGKLKEIFGPLESSLQTYSFAVAHKKELNLARLKLSLHRCGKPIYLSQDFEGLVVLFDEARFSFLLKAFTGGKS